jgi:hypothetical protein
MMRQTFRARPKSFLDAPRREWQFQTYAWLLRHSGGYSKFLESELVLPIPDHFPDSGMQGHAAVAALFRLVRDHAGMAEWPCHVEPEPQAAPESVPADRLRVIHYPRGMREVTSLVAHFAHGLARYLVETIEEPPPGGAELYEPAVDLAAVFMGFGVFMANTSAHAAHWDLNEGELAHALAMYCLLKKSDPDSIDHHLNPHLRKHLRLASRDLAQLPLDFQRLRAVFPVNRVESDECTMPTRSG